MPILLTLFLLFLSPLPAHGGGKSLPFEVGERLSFDITWFGIPAGRSELAVEERTSFAGTPVLRLVSTARSNDFLSAFYPVEDRVESLWDPEERHPLFYRLIQREGRYRSRKQVVFDQESNLAFYRRNDDPAWGYVIRYKVQDPLSSLYLLRALRKEVRAGSRVRVRTFASRKNVETEVEIEAREAIDTRWGEIPALRIRPRITYSDGPLRNKGDVRLWVTDDRYRIPLKMSSVVLIIGRVTAELVEAEGIAEDSLLARAMRRARARAQ